LRPAFRILEFGLAILAARIIALVGRLQKAGLPKNPTFRLSLTTGGLRIHDRRAAVQLEWNRSS
jgi:hypothetical protein